MNTLRNLGQLQTYLGPLLSDVMEELRTREWTKAPASVTIFFDKFSTPKQIDTWGQRVAINSRLFQTNYIILLALILLLYIFTHPFSVLSFVFSAAACHAATTPYPPVTLSTLHPRLPARLASPAERVAGATIVSSFLLFFTGAFGSLLRYVIFAIVLSGAHASFRHTGTTRDEAKESVKIEEIFE